MRIAPIALLLVATAVGCSGSGRVEIPATVPELRPGVLQGYLAPAALPNSALLLPPPPEPGSAAMAEDVEASEAALALRGTPRCLRRAEAVWLLRRGITVESRGFDRAETRKRFQEGGLFRFGCASAIQSSVRTATILFADIRGFTRASEGQVSEGELAQELYEIFDPAALIVRRFGGSVDAYLGDGFMATYAGGAPAAENALAAVRTAVALQQVIGRLRRQGRTAFCMDISLHCGRVSVARFLRDEREVQTTYIGRQVNVAGRLSILTGINLVSGIALP